MKKSERSKLIFALIEKALRFDDSIDQSENLFLPKVKFKVRFEN